MANQSTVAVTPAVAPIVNDAPPVACTQHALATGWFVDLVFTQAKMTLLKAVGITVSTTARIAVVPWSMIVLLSSKKIRLSEILPNNRTISVHY